MKFSHYIAAGLVVLLAGGATAQPGDDRTPTDTVEYPPVYRVEAIVFRHVDGRSDRARAAAPDDFTRQLDPVLVAQANRTAQRHLSMLAGFLPVAAIPGEIDDAMPFLQTDEETVRPIPPAYAALGDLSGPVQRAMTRLIDAPEYEPVIARAWMQPAPRGGTTARVRLHDQTVVDALEPEPADTENPAPVARLPRLDTPISDMNAATTASPPPALEIYRVDGTIRLRRRQFLHLDLDLVWQAPVRALAESARQPGADGDADEQWQLHRLRQSRIVEPGRLEYFDSSLFGVLVRIERFEQVVPEIEEPEPEAPAQDTGEPGQVAGGVTDSSG